jgi:gliding motility-associated-like protein
VHIDGYAKSPTDFLPPDTAICTYESLTLRAKSGYNNYIWSDNSSGPVITIKQPGLYYLEVTDENSCVGTDSILVNSKQCAIGFHIPSAFTPNGDGKNDIFRPLLYGDILAYKFAIYNRWGQPVFQSSDPSKGWDGNVTGVPQDTNTFAWICQYQLAGEPAKTEKGTVVLIR